MFRRSSVLVAAAAAVGAGVLLPASSAQAATCPISYGAHDATKPNKLYLYYPTASDSTFPEFGVDHVTSPAAPFRASDLTSYTGSTAALRTAVTDVVKSDYCEFNVQVRQTTSAPPSTFARRNVVAIGTDGTGISLYGQAQRVDTGDANTVDSARVWAGTYQEDFTGAGDALNGANSTLTRWANSIGGTTAHEAGHNYGLSHPDGLSVGVGEDALTHHLMASGSNYSGEDRAGYRRHFSDHEFSLLASNVGLSIQTMHNWDLVNPNAQSASRLRMEFLSANPSAILSWAYTGDRSPWNSPSVTSLGTATFKGQTLNKYRLEWSAAKSWTGGSNGVVPGGGTFHVGATLSGVNFDTPDAVIINKLQLLNSAGTALSLQPRLPGYDSGTLDTSDGLLNVRFFNTLASSAVQIKNVRVSELPRTISINSMMPQTKRLLGISGGPVTPWPESTRIAVGREPITVKPGEDAPVQVAAMKNQRHILGRSIRCRALNLGDSGKDNPDTAGCVNGWNVDLFPSTTLYVTADVIAPNMKHWDRKAKKYVRGDVTTKIFTQIAGRHPDLNRNKVDDAIDIASGTSTDRNGDGVPDDAQKQPCSLVRVCPFNW